MERKDRRGGARKGAGRPCDGAEKRVTINMMVAPETARKITEFAAARNISRGKMADLLVEAFSQACINHACSLRQPLGPQELLPLSGGDGEPGNH